MDIKTLEIDKINPAVYNPRKNLQPGDPEYEKLKKSITEFDMVEPLVWNKRTKNLVGGHQRLKILKELDYTEVEVSVVDLSLTKEKALNLALNKISGEWDFPMLKDLLQELDTGDFDMEITGFDLKEIEDLMTQFHVPEEGLTDDDAVPDATESISRRGDLWSLGNHRLLCGDATVITDVEKLMGGEKADMVFTDPPYNIDIGRLGVPYASHNDNLAKSSYESMLKTALENLVSISTNCPFYVMSSNRDVDVIKRLFLDSNIHYHQLLIWGKPSAMMGNSDYIQNFEIISFGYCGRHPNVNNKGLLACEIFNKDENVKSIGHPTSRPIMLLTKFIGNSSSNGGNVVDLFGGSGSTLIACEKLGRRCYMMEIDEHYCDVIIKRWEDFTGKKVVRIDED